MNRTPREELRKWFDKEIKEKTIVEISENELSNIEDVARGGYCVVKSAIWHQETPTKVALKYLRFWAWDELAIDRFAKEVCSYHYTYSKPVFPNLFMRFIAFY